MRRIGLGFAGVGWLGESLIKELPSVPELSLAGVQDARLDLAGEVAARYRSPWFGQHFPDLLQVPEVDVVVICTPNALHVSQAQHALQAGKHVLVQKPLALSVADAEATIALAQTTRRLLFVDYTYRFLETVDVFRRALVDVGRVQSVRAEFHNIYGPGAEKTWFFDRQLSGGGALVDLGVHLLDLVLWLVEPARVVLEDARLAPDTIEYRADLRLRLDDSVPFELSVSWNAPIPETRIGAEIDAEGGRLRWHNVDGSFFRFRSLRAEHILMERETTLRSDTWRAFWQALRAFREGRAPEIDRRVYALLEAAYMFGQ